MVVHQPTVDGLGHGALNQPQPEDTLIRWLKLQQPDKLKLQWGARIPRLAVQDPALQHAPVITYRLQPVWANVQDGVRQAEQVQAVSGSSPCGLSMSLYALTASGTL